MHTVLNQDAGADPRMAPNMHPASHHSAAADPHAITDHRPVADGRITVNPGAMPDPAAGADPGALLHIRHRTHAGGVCHGGAGSDKAAPVGMAGIAGDLPAVVFH
jgi:hypothetical protein